MAEDTRTNEQTIDVAWYAECIRKGDDPEAVIRAALAAAGRLRDNTPTGDTAALILDLRTWAGARPYLYGDEHRALLRQVADALEASEAARATLEARMPCDGGCNYNDGPDETCSRDGRPVAEVWGIANAATARANQAECDVEVLRERVANLEAVIAQIGAAIALGDAGASIGFDEAYTSTVSSIEKQLERAGDPVVLREHDAKVLRDAAADLPDRWTPAVSVEEWLKARADRIERGEGS